MKKIKDNLFYSFLLSLGISALALITSSLLMAFIAYSTEDPTSGIGGFSLFAMIISAIICGVATTRIKGEGGVKFTVLVALALVLIMLIFAVISGKGHVAPSAFMNYLCFMGISLLSSHLGKKRERRRRR